MKDRIVFFVLGAVLATVAFFVGDMDKATAQDSTRIIEEDVIIKGKLTVAGGELLIKYNPTLVKKDHELDSSISILTTDRAASIMLQNGPINRRTRKHKSSLTIIALDMDNGEGRSVIELAGKYEKDKVSIWSNRRMNRPVSE